MQPDSFDRLQAPSRQEADAAVQRARRLFQGTLASWACDLLRLQANGRRLPTWTAAPIDAIELDEPLTQPVRPAKHRRRAA
jgi:hypothetical protein